MTSSKPDDLPPEVSRKAYEEMVGLLTGLLDSLLEERQALTGTSPDELYEIVQRKESICADIARRQPALLAGLTPDGRLPESMTELRTLAQRCQAENAHNGRIANRAKHTTRTLIGILTGDSDGDLYDKPGADQTRGRKAKPGHHLGSA
jgi:flagellar biosynthesis/type III secretory pathway chaperone